MLPSPVEVGVEPLVADPLVRLGQLEQIAQPNSDRLRGPLIRGAQYAALQRENTPFIAQQCSTCVRKLPWKGGCVLVLGPPPAFVRMSLLFRLHSKPIAALENTASKLLTSAFADAGMSAATSEVGSFCVQTNSWVAAFPKRSV